MVAAAAGQKRVGLPVGSCGNVVRHIRIHALIRICHDKSGGRVTGPVIAQCGVLFGVQQLCGAEYEPPRQSKTQQASDELARRREEEAAADGLCDEGDALGSQLRSFAQKALQGLFPGSRFGLLLPQQRQQEAHGGQAVELEPVLLQSQKLGLHFPAAPVKVGFHSALRDVKRVGDLRNPHFLIVEHTHHQTLLRGKLRQNLADQAGGLLPVHLQLRLKVRSGLRDHVRIPVRFLQIREGQRLLSGHFAGRDVDRDPPQPGQKGVVVFQGVKTLKSPQIAVLQDVPCKLLVPDHGADAAVKNGTAAFVQSGKSGLVALSCTANQLAGLFKFVLFHLFLRRFPYWFVP